MQVLRQVLPLPFLRVGSLLAAEHGGNGSSSGGASVPAGQQPLDERWHRMWFVLDADSFRTAPEPHRQSGAASLWDHMSTRDFQDDFQERLLEPLSTSRRAMSPSAAAPVFHALTRETVQLRASRCCSLQVGANRLVCPWRAHNCEEQQAGVVLAATYQCSLLNHLRSVSGSLLDHRRRAGGGIQHPAVRHTVRQTRGGPLAAAGRGAEVPQSLHFHVRVLLDLPWIAAGSAPEAEYNIPLSNIQCAKPAADPSLPPGAALWVSLASRPLGLYFVAGGQEDADGWIDALSLVAHLASAARLATLRASLEAPA